MFHPAHGASCDPCHMVLLQVGPGLIARPVSQYCVDLLASATNKRAHTATRGVMRWQLPQSI